MRTHIIHFLQGPLKLQLEYKETKGGDWKRNKIWDAPSPVLLWHLVAGIAAFFNQFPRGQCHKLGSHPATFRAAPLKQ